MPLYQHPLFTIDLNKVIAVNQNEDEASVTIRTVDQRKIEVATGSAQEGVELLNDIAGQWEQAVGPLLRYARHAFLTSAIYSIQVEGDEVYIYLQEHSVSFGFSSSEQALEILAELTSAWRRALGEEQPQTA
ncbi:MAG TPA: hypothetical protein VLT36_17420 [Candidatus Dormibacteraeota bacterium]|nr:hypothetical protein [Candidatus Dormibacteraeota bacterium]